MRPFRFVSTALLVASVGSALAQTAPLQTIDSASSKATILEDGINLRKGPSASTERVAILRKNAEIAVQSSQGEWIQLKLEDGRTGWVHQKYAKTNSPVAPAEARSPGATPGKLTPVAAGTLNVPVSHQGAVQPVVGTKQSEPTVASTSQTQIAATSKPDIQSETPANATPMAPAGILKQDFTPKQGMAGTVGDGWKLLAYLLPTLCLVVLLIKGLKKLQDRTGLLGLVQNASPAPSGKPAKTIAPGPSFTARLRSAVVGGAALNKARQQAHSSIRIIESTPLAGYNLCLVAVKDRTLLLSAGPNGMTVLSEWEIHDETAPASAFTEALRLAEVPTDTLQAPEPLAAVRTMDDTIREAREAIARAARESSLDNGIYARTRADFRV